MIRKGLPSNKKSVLDKVNWCFCAEMVKLQVAIKNKKRVCFINVDYKANAEVSRLGERSEAIRWIKIPIKNYHSFTSSRKSFQGGFRACIRSSFFYLLPALICFSLAIASSIIENDWYQTRILQLYFEVKLFLNSLFLCSRMRLGKLELSRYTKPYDEN